MKEIVITLHRSYQFNKKELEKRYNTKIENQVQFRELGIKAAMEYMADESQNFVEDYADFVSATTEIIH